MVGTPHVLPIGSTVVYFNQWTGFDKSEISAFFRALTSEDLAILKKGDSVWVDIDPLHPHGKVYGYVKATVEEKKLTNPTNPSYQISWQGGSYCGVANEIVKNKFYAVRDEPALAKLVRHLPLALVVREKAA